MSEQNELRRRVEALEGQLARIGELEAEVARLREDAAATRTLASMADRDVAEMRTTMRGHTQVLNALRETQIEQGHTLEGIASVVGGLVVGQAQVSERLNGLQSGQARLDERVGGLEAGQTAILEQLKRVLARLEPGASES